MFARIVATLLPLASVSSALADGSTETFIGLDLNKNHLSELFEQLYPAASNPNEDTDGDGQTNLQEAISGTNPLNTGDRLDFTNVASTPSTITANWKTAKGKMYQIQSSTSLSGGWTNEGTPVMGLGSELAGSCSNHTTRMFLRLQVQDIDSDNDGVTDWEEYMAGTNPVKRDSENDGISDYDRLTRKLGMSSFVDVIAIDSTAVESGEPATFKIIRRGGLAPITVNVGWSGTATFGVDYTAITSVSLGFGENTATIVLAPLNDAIVETPNEIATVTISPGAGYNVGDLSNASATIFATGTGLTGNYFQNSLTTGATYNSSAPYVSGANFNPAELIETRLDGPIYFSTAAAPFWNAVNTARTSQFSTSDDYHSVVWNGYVLAPATQTYTFFCNANTGSRLWVNGVSLFDSTTATPVETAAWSGSSGTELSKTIALEGGRLYPVRLEFHDETGSTAIRLRWSHPSLTKTDIPLANLFPAASPPVFPATAFAVAFVGGPFSYQAAPKPSASSFAAGGLPSGLSINTSTGLISGTPTALPGLYFTTVVASNMTGSANLNLTILVLQSGGGLTRDVWNGLASNSVEDIPLASSPDVTTTVTEFAAPVNAGDNFGERIRGFITAPSTGNYTFFLTSGDENAELWVSADDDPSRTLKRSFVTNVAAAGDWAASTSQKSLEVEMEAGKRYYVESRRRELSGDDQLKIGWLKPGQTGTTPSEIIPSYVLTPFTSGAALTGNGTLYLATMTPQAGAVTYGNGTAVLLVNEAETAATMSYTYSGLTGPINNQHIHDAASLPGPAKAIIYDLDEFQPDSFGVRTWNFIATGNHTVADIVNCIKSGTAYINLHTAAYPDGEIKGTFFKASGIRSFVPPAPPVVAGGDIPDPLTNDAEAARFMMQATMGPKRDADGATPYDIDSIENVAALGYEGWINQQFAISPGPDPETLVPQTIVNPDSPTAAQNAGTSATPYSRTINVNNGSGPMATFIKEYYDKYPLIATFGNTTANQAAAELNRAWWKQSITSPDQLRQRVAFALSQILVVSEQGILDENARAVAHYYDLLAYHGLGNFRTLLEKVTLNVPMGRYLDMFRNKKPSASSIPNENYAREIMQLFSIGLNRLHPDGTLVLNAQGFPVPTYGQDQVVGLSHVFTGWTHSADNSSFNSGNSTNYILPMISFATQHSFSEKTLLDNYIMPTGTAASTQPVPELQSALDMIFHHPNVGPFICRQLIQRLVTANPSKGYIYRTARVFADNGSGVRGDMKAVVKAILLDPDARTLSARQSPEFGKLKEPLLRMTGLVRALRGFSNNALYSINQLPPAQAATIANIDIASPLPQIIVPDADDATDPGQLNNPRITQVDGFRLWPGMRVLVRAQTNAAENGLYEFVAEGSPLTNKNTADGRVRVSFGSNSTATATRGVTFQIAGGGSTITTSTANPLASQWGIGETGSESLFQTPLKSPTVFNYYEPDYQFPGSTGAAKLYGPEFQILSETSIVKTANFCWNLLTQSGAGGGNDMKVEYLSRPTQAVPYPWPNADVTGNPLVAKSLVTSDLLDELNILLLGGRMSNTAIESNAALRTILTNYLATLTGTSTTVKVNRVKEACYLIAISPEYSVQK